MQWPCNSPSSGLPPSLSSTPNFYKCRTPWIKPLSLDQLLSLKLIITFYRNGVFHVPWHWQIWLISVCGGKWLFNKLAWNGGGNGPAFRAWNDSYPHSFILLYFPENSTRALSPEVSVMAKYPQWGEGRRGGWQSLPAMLQRMLFRKNTIPLPELELHDILAYMAPFQILVPLVIWAISGTQDIRTK